LGRRRWRYSALSDALSQQEIRAAPAAVSLQEIAGNVGEGVAGVNRALRARRSIQKLLESGNELLPSAALHAAPLSLQLSAQVRGHRKLNRRFSMGLLRDDLQHLRTDLEHVHGDVEHLEKDLSQCDVDCEPRLSDLKTHVRDLDAHLHDVLSHVMHLEEHEKGGEAGESPTSTQ
jgi:hypothetical protein